MHNSVASSTSHLVVQPSPISIFRTSSYQNETLSISLNCPFCLLQKPVTLFYILSMNLTTLVVHNICFSVSVSLRITHPCCSVYRDFLLSKPCPFAITCVSCSLIPRFIQMCCQSHPDNTWLCHFYPHPHLQPMGPQSRQRYRVKVFKENCTLRDMEKGLYEAPHCF